MDSYFKPVLISSTVVLLFNQLASIPVLSRPEVISILGGILAVILFKRDFKGDRSKRVSASDLVVLGLGTGILAGSILALIIAIKMQDLEFKRQIIELVNKSTQMRSYPGLGLEDITPVFITVMAAANIVFNTIFSLFGSLISGPFINKKKK